MLSTGGQCEDGSLGPVPENFLIRPSVPQVEILRRAAAFVTHAGMNSVQEALYHGVPLVMAPQAADQFWISARAREIGAGVVLPRRPRRGAIAKAVAEVLSHPAYAEAARHAGASLHAAGGHTQAAAVIQRFMRRAANRPPEPACRL